MDESTNPTPDQPESPRIGRPPMFSDSLADEICDRMSTGESLASICRDDHMPALQTVYRWLNKYPAFSENYARAQIERGQYWGEHVADVARRVEAGELDANAARVALDGYKWTAARQASKNWGDRTQLDHTGKVDVKLIDLSGVPQDEAPPAE